MSSWFSRAILKFQFSRKWSMIVGVFPGTFIEICITVFPALQFMPVFFSSRRLKYPYPIDFSKASEVKLKSLSFPWKIQLNCVKRGGAIYRFGPHSYTRLIYPELSQMKNFMHAQLFWENYNKNWRLRWKKSQKSFRHLQNNIFPMRNLNKNLYVIVAIDKI